MKETTMKDANGTRRIVVPKKEIQKTTRMIMTVITQMHPVNSK
jgi:hypothetical protein